MGETFEAITTQEQLDTIIKGRLERETKKHTEATAELQKELDTLKTSYNEASGKLKEYETKAAETATELERLHSQVKKYETDSVKTGICKEFNIPFEMRDRLRGETEDEIRADAQALSKLLPKPVAPQRSTETVRSEKDIERDSLREMLKNLDKEN